ARLLVAVALRSDRLVRRALAGVDALQVPERQGGVRVVSPRLVEAAHRHDVEVHVWTVNDPADMRRLIGLGVDGLVTDRADVALEIVA
ncbi:MAG: glycerophosphodiester phosphodiesterase, partial [Microbacterium sp.]|nr:glycerophosphodiester phosphodiesterase [Microbacterium sp.]